MNASYALITKFKEKYNLDTDKQVVDLMPKMSKGNLSDIKAGKRPLTEEQSIWLAERCGHDLKLVLAQRAAETAKQPSAKAAWAEVICILSNK